MKDKENIITEIERRIRLFKKEHINTTPKSAGRLSLGGRIAALEEILVFIQSLPTKQPSEELKKVASIFMPEEAYHAIIENEEEGSGESVYDYNQMVNMFITGANWQKKRTIDKACEWLKENIYNRVYKCNDSLGFPTAAFLEEFKKTMEDK